MFDLKSLDELTQKLSGTLPPAFKSIKSDIEENFRTTLEYTFQKMNLVSREEFDVQTAVLSRTREKVEQLEARVAALEEKYLG